MKLAFPEFIFFQEKKRGAPPNQSRAIKLPPMNTVIGFALFIKGEKQ